MFLLKDGSPREVQATIPHLSRRHFLRVVGWMAGTSGWMGAWLAGCSSFKPETSPRSGDLESLLGRSTFVRFGALAEAVLPSLEEAPFDAGTLHVAERLGDQFVQGGRGVIRAIQGALIMLEFLPLITERSGSRFSRLDRSERQAVLAAWLKSRWSLKRLIASGLRKAIVFSAYNHADTWTSIGYAGPWVRPGMAPTPLIPLGTGVSPENVEKLVMVGTGMGWKGLSE